MDKYESMDSREERPSLKAYKIMRYIKVNSLDAGLDVFDLEDMSIHEVLSAYGICEELSSSEEKVIRQELYSLIEQKEFAEVAHCAGRESFLA